MKDREVLITGGSAGIGKATAIDAAEIRWPAGTVEKLANVKVNALNRFVEGQGKK